jgi:hypothetical protein
MTQPTGLFSWHPIWTLTAQIGHEAGNPYVISGFKNPSGKIVFQIYAPIDGKRFWKNFGRTQSRSRAPNPRHPEI